MLEIERKPIKKILTKEMLEETKDTDIIITKHQNKTIYNEDNSKTIKRIPIKINITKKVNETAKTIKNYNAEEKLQQLEKIYRTETKE
jgi:ribosomal protein L31E